jgi:hypothetical protein
MIAKLWEGLVLVFIGLTLSLILAIALGIVAHLYAYYFMIGWRLIG